MMARGEVVADPQAILAFPIGGIVKEVYAAPGDAVTKGMVLAELDALALQRAALQSASDLALARIELARAEARAAREYDLEIAQQRVTLAEFLAPSMLDAVVRSESNVTLARLQLAQVESRGVGGYEVEIARERLAQAQALDGALKAQLSDVGSDRPVSRRDVLARAANLAIAKLELVQAEALKNEAQYAVDIARERVALAQALEVLVQAQLGDTVLKASFSGTLTSFNKEPGDSVAAHDPVGILADVSNLQVRAMLPIDVVGMMAVGQAVEIVLDGQPSRVYAATVQAIDLVVQPWQGQSVQEVAIDFDAGQDISPLVGIGVTIRLVEPLRENVVLVPQDAIITVAGQTYLDVLSGENQVQRIPVVTGASATGAVEIVSGVEEGQTVVLP